LETKEIQGLIDKYVQDAIPKNL